MELTLSTAIKYLREQQGLSARRVSTLAGLSPSYVSKVEKGDMEPSFKAFCRIAQVLDMTEPEVLMLVKLHYGLDSRPSTATTPNRV